MNKSERTAALRRLKPATWYAFCQMEAMHEEEIKISKSKLALKLDLSLPTLAKHLATWASDNLVQEIDGGFRIAQMDGQPSKITEDPIMREFKSPKDSLVVFREFFLNYGKCPCSTRDAAEVQGPRICSLLSHGHVDNTNKLVSAGHSRRIVEWPAVMGSFPLQQELILLRKLKSLLDSSLLV